MRCIQCFRWGKAMALLALFAGMFVATPALKAESVPSARVLPSDVYVYFSIPSVTELKARWQKTAFGQIQNDPAFADFKKEIDEVLEKATREFETQTRMKVKDLLDIPTGEVAVALMKPPKEKLAAVAFLDFGKSEDMVDQLLAKLEDAMDAKNADRKVQEFENTRIVVYTLPNAEKETGPFKPGFSYFVKDTQLVLSTHVSALESVLSRWGGKAARSFADDRIFKHIMEKCKTGNREPIVKWFVNPIEALKAAVMAGADGNPQAAMALGFLPLLGLNDFRGMGGAGDWAIDGFEGISKTMLYVDQPPQGLLNMFHFPTADLTPPKWVSEKTQSYMAANWDAEGAYGAVETLVDTFQGAGALERIIDDLAERPGGPGIHIKKDILDQLNGRIYVVNQGVEGLEQKVPKILASVGVRDTKKMQDFVAKILKTQGVPAETRNFRGETIVEINTGNAQAKVALCVFNNSLMMTSDVSLLEQVIRGDRTQKPLADSPEYRQIAKAFPEKTSMLSFQQTDEQFKIVYEQLRKGKVGEAADIPDDVKNAVDGAKNALRKLPPFDALKKYLPISGSYTIPDDNGVLFVNISQEKK